MNIVRFPQTYEDITEIAAFLGQDDPAVADRFYNSYEQTLKTLARMPKIGSARESKNLGEIRMWFVRDFENVLILYKESSDEIAILRLIHSSRDYTRFI